MKCYQLKSIDQSVFKNKNVNEKLIGSKILEAQTIRAIDNNCVESAIYWNDKFAFKKKLKLAYM